VTVDNRLRIHFHTDCYWFGGSEIMVLMLAKAAFADTGMDPVFTYRAWPEYEVGLRSQVGPDVIAEPIHLPDPADLKFALTNGSTGTWARLVRAVVSLLPIRPLCTLWDVGRMYFVLRRRRPHLLHVNNGGYPGAISCNAAAVAAGLLHIPVIYVVNNLAHPYDRPGRWLAYPFDRAVARSVRRFVTGSTAASEILRTVLRIEDERLAVIPNAVVPGPTLPAATGRDHLEVAPQSLVVTVIARLEKRKGHRHLLDAFSRLPALMREKTILMVAGSGPELSNLEAQARSLGIADRVRFLGSYADRWSLYELSDVVVLPSIADEDCPLVVLDAMAMGRPVVATTIAGIPELVVDGVTGKLIPPGDAKALADALSGLLDDADGRAKMGVEARIRYLGQYTPARAVADYWSAYAALAPRASALQGSEGSA
jgi:glycosyltransferase involved in cell wall biosynthesis